MNLKKILHNKYIQRAIWIIVILAIWEYTALYSGISPLLLPPVEDVLYTLGTSLFNGDLLNQILFSLLIIAAGMIISIILSILLALLSVRFKIAASFIDTITALAHPLPGLALMPLIIIWFGMGTNAVLFLIIHSALWPILLNTIAGLKAVPEIYIDVGKNLSMSQIAISWEIMFRASLSYVISGIKIAWARAWRTFIGAEMVFGAIGTKGGIGWFILKQRTFMNTSALYAGIIIVVIIGMLVEDLLFTKAEKKIIDR